MASQPQTIFSLEARTNCFLELATKSLDSSATFDEIWNLNSLLVGSLAEQNFDYLDLRSVLVPSTDPKKTERAYIFDWSDASSAMYGNEFFALLFEQFDRQSMHSVAAGDFLAVQKGHLFIAEDLVSRIDGHGELKPSSLNQLYVIYLNNVSESLHGRITNAAKLNRAFRGSVDMTYLSPTKVMLACTLCSVGIWHKGVMLLPGWSMDEHVAGEYLSPYNFTDSGARIVTVASELWGLFMKYKIEAPAALELNDIALSVNALSQEVFEFSSLEVILEDSKHSYLRKEKSGSVKRSGLSGLSSEEVSEQIRARLAQNYIFRLTRMEDYGVQKFETVVEFDGQVRTRIAFEYMTEEQKLRIITMF